MIRFTSGDRGFARDRSYVNTAWAGVAKYRQKVTNAKILADSPELLRLVTN